MKDPAREAWLYQVHMALERLVPASVPLSDWNALHSKVVELIDTTCRGRVICRGTREAVVATKDS